MPRIAVVAAVTVLNGKVLLVRSRNHDQDLYVFIGGKKERGENSVQTLFREFREEVTGAVILCQEQLGTVTGEGADGQKVRLECFRVHLEGEPEPRGEIEALCWVSYGEAQALYKKGRLSEATARGIDLALNEGCFAW